MFKGPHTAASKQRMSKTKKEMYRGKNNPMYGKQHSDDSKQLMADIRRDRCWVHDPMTLIEKCVCKDQLHQYIKEGWVKGRSIGIK